MSISAPFLEFNKDSRLINVNPQGIKALKNANGKVKIVTWLSPGSQPEIKQVYVRLYPCSDQTLCVLDISNLWDSLGNDDSIETLALSFCLLLSSSFIVVCPPVDMKITLERFCFIRGIVNSFDGNVGLLHSSIERLPKLFLLVFVDNPITTTSNQILETLSKQENGFSKDIAVRNQLRDMIQELIPMQEGIGIPFTAADMFMNDFNEILLHGDISHRILSVKDTNIQDLVMTASFLSILVPAAVETVKDLKTLRLSDVKAALVNPYLEESFKQSIAEYYECIEYLRNNSRKTSSTSSSSSNLTEEIISLKRLTDDHNLSTEKAVAYLRSLFTVDNEKYSEYKQRLLIHVNNIFQSHMAILEAESNNRCEAIASELEDVLSLWVEDDKGVCSESVLPIPLGKASNAYHNILSFKSQIESFVSKFQIRTVGTELENCRTKILHKYLAKYVHILLVRFQDWLTALEQLTNTSKAKLAFLESEIYRLKEQLVEVEANSAHEISVAEESLSKLQAQLDQLRRTHATVNEAGSSNLEGLMDRLDRAARLNEQEKNELAQGLMAMQHRILKAQDRALELRLQREASTAILHKELIEGEKTSHGRYKADISRQHELLEEQLVLERMIAVKSAEYASEIYVLENQHRSSLEMIQAKAQEKLRHLREAASEEREIREVNHERTLSMKRAELMTVESQLVLMVDAYVRTAEKKPCKVM